MEGFIYVRDESQVLDLQELLARNVFDSIAWNTNSFAASEQLGTYTRKPLILGLSRVTSYVER